MQNSQIIWDRALINRYDLSGPRYTSYPTAPQFHEQFTIQNLQVAINRSNKAARPLSLYFHIPFCSTVCYYCACNKIITANKNRAEPYLNRLTKEIAMQAKLFDNTRPVHQLHWGGGTPTYINDEEKRLLMNTTRKHFNLLNDDTGEYSIEIHPGDMDSRSISCLRQLGFNRLSMGIQDFDPTVQKAVNRFNSEADVKDLVNAARAEGFHSISMDLIYGLPHQSWQTFSRTLDSVITLNPDRLSIFNYAHMPHLFKVQKQIDEKALPSPEEKLKIAELTTQKLIDAGFVYIGMDHFAKPDDELALAQKQGLLQRNFQGYSTHGNCDLLSFGVSSISAIDNVFVQNHKQIDDYQNAIDSGNIPLARGFELSHDDLIRQYVIKQLICHFNLNYEQVEDKFNISLTDYFSKELIELNTMALNGLLDTSPTGVTIKPAGRLLIRRICMVFDAYLKKNSSEIRYSKII